MHIGIESASFYTSHYFLELATLAKARGVAEEKYHIGLGIQKMAVSPPDEDVVTLGANAALEAIKNLDKDSIRLLLFATESGIDQSKAAGLYIHKLLKLSPHCRVLELKQACYSATGALMLAQEWTKNHPDQKALIIAADIARYGLGMPGEPSQGAGAVALIVSTTPKLLSFEAGSGIYTEDAMDFWRPNYRDEALVDGKHSVDLYLKALKESWQDYQKNTQRTYQDHAYFLFHIPIPRLAEKAYQRLALVNNLEKPSEQEIAQKLNDSLTYSRIIGNCYTASLYLGLLSLLEHRQDLAHQRIGLYSYGSGCIGEFFSVKITPGYSAHLKTTTHKNLLEHRKNLDQATYESYYSFTYPTDGSELAIPTHQTGHFRLAAIKAHQRIYTDGTPIVAEKVENKAISIPQPYIEQLETTARGSVSAKAPGKLILTGEHAILHGVPAIAIAIDRFCTTTVSPLSKPRVLFNLANLEHKRERTLRHLKRLKQVLQERHNSFTQGERSITDVIKEPFYLLEYTTGAFIDKLNLKFKEGFSLDTCSTIPTGCGMGSSAAAIVSLNYALSHFMNKPLSIHELFELNLAAENLQHGRSSGLDLQVSMHGGCIYFTQKEIAPLTFPDWALSIINTGTPESSTGECIAHTHSFFNDTELLQAFNEVSTNIHDALKTQNQQIFFSNIHRNHLLLQRIGVVPDNIHQLILDLYQHGIVAKLSGAGAVRGKSAGILLVFEHSDRVNSILKKLNSSFIAETIQLVTQGVALT
jgi:hydroxymethylglutaryl-CoA synthase